MMNRILVVCTGNVCRSPAAQALLSRALPGRTIESAGIAAIGGTPVDPVMSELLVARGFGELPHRARRVDDRVCRWADLILVMETAQRHLIERAYPMTRGRVYRLTERDQTDVPDPYRRSRHVYDYAMKLIERGVVDWAVRIARLESDRPRRPDAGTDAPEYLK
ncbi:low molecular weight protein-tyrosine-phosphatase [Burkholderia cenocepacia]|uniref:low molecular weight protein-tyrosine-phosphatase n=2 Tax=Burkholderia cenocepacia TaxID=95486 RepID=UPI001B99EA7A|nr:low molecular weight protein-tyrosine-phosphatase [Burkholderia cenocepacia]MBR8095473.1 low molecular weight phosphotyrosine protein phosphatase [Burkholderia cenocepacia]MCW5115830.1 low molecular weight phosphotyrosine protein phosphatase [Burkholderia cenocepacia]MCW5132030.1 low molecular weight phosphotyrosine protein phosphatase [Burkholderia cenocepacia]MCW5175996.1 low molecular weight phosphotyrosine protein phosphatase [Burkholderia cenocepacia]MDI9686229.1 low molecular weight p